MHHCIVGISNSSNSTSTTLLLQSRRDVSRNVNDLDIISIPNSGIECNSVISNNDIDGSIKLISTVGKRKRKPGTYKKGVCVEQLLLVERRTHDFDDIKGDGIRVEERRELKVQVLLIGLNSGIAVQHPLLVGSTEC